MLGPIEKYLLEKIKAEGSIHITLIDPEKATVQQAANIAESSRNSGTVAIMVGGSTFASQAHLDDVVKSIKNSVKLPTILFPNNITGISKEHQHIHWWSEADPPSLSPYILIKDVQITTSK